MNNCPKNCEVELDGSKGLLSCLKKGLEQGMGFQRLGEKFFVPPEQIKAYFDSTLGTFQIYFYSENPNTIATYSIQTYGTRGALEKERLIDIYKEEIYYD